MLFFLRTKNRMMRGPSVQSKILRKFQSSFLQPVSAQSQSKSPLVMICHGCSFFFILFSSKIGIFDRKPPLVVVQKLRGKDEEGRGSKNENHSVKTVHVEVGKEGNSYNVRKSKYSHPKYLTSSYPLIVLMQTSVCMH